MIVAKQIKKKYGDIEVLKGLDVEINKGEIVTILGKSGAGKSTLLHILGTLDLPDTGTLHINGIDVGRMKEKDLAAFRNETIGFVFQFHHLMAEFTAIENVIIPALIKGISNNKATQKGMELLDYLGIAARKDHKPSEMSGGEQQRVAFARAMINNPTVIFADEPTGNLDSVTSTDLHNLIVKLRKDFAQTYVIVTHNEELAALSDRSIYMENGLLKLDGSHG